MTGTETAHTPICLFLVELRKQNLSNTAAKTCSMHGRPVGLCDFLPITPQNCVLGRHVGPIIILMTISLDGKICSKSRILSLFVNIEVFRSQLC